MLLRRPTSIYTYPYLKTLGGEPPLGALIKNCEANAYYREGLLSGGPPNSGVLSSKRFTDMRLLGMLQLSHLPPPKRWENTKRQHDGHDEPALRLCGGTQTVS